MKGKYIGITIPGDNKQLTLCEVEAYTIPASKIVPVSASQSSTHKTAVASNGIDGNTSNGCKWKDTNNPVACTNNDAALDKKNPWWQADFGTEKTLSYLEVIPRIDVNALKNFEVSVGNNPDPLKNPTCGEKNSNIGANPLVVDCHLKGRYVSIFLREIQTHLSFCEVNFYGY